MKPDSIRWNEVTASQFPWEKEALDYLREQLPDQDPYRAWSNFEFRADDGSINEVDCLVITPTGFTLIEIKSRPGVVTGDNGTWTWTHDGRIEHLDNPLLLANRKAKKLASLLKRQGAMKGAWTPFLEARIFLSAPDIKVQLDKHLLTQVHVRDDAKHVGGALQGVLAALKGDHRPPGPSSLRRIDTTTSRAVARAIEQAGIRRSVTARRVADYQLEQLIGEGPEYQDWRAKHVSLQNTIRRVRIYLVQPAATEDHRKTVRRAAEREYQILQRIHHPGIVRAEYFTETEQGPAVIFEYDPQALRFDHFLATRLENLTAAQRIEMLRNIAEIVRYAHTKRLVHRALSPLSILVRRPDGLLRDMQIFNWQTAGRLTSTSDEGTQLVSGTSHLDRLIDNAAAAYLAPEALTDGEAAGETLDVFSLGAIAFHIFAGRPPASSFAELTQILREHRGLNISAAMNGASKRLHELIQLATLPDVSMRLDSVAEFLHHLVDVEGEMCAPDMADLVNAEPETAAKGALLKDGSCVIERLGQGGVAIALLVSRGATEGVLKVALDAARNERIKEEGQVLRKLRHPNIVALLEETQVGDRAALFMSRAGQDTLSEWLRKEGRVQAEFLERWGDDLLSVLKYLENEGIAHRDIKPENIGISPAGGGKRRQLVVFDFSLSRTPVENVTAGTQHYLDPFLTTQKPPRWGFHAERYAAAVTLYEMATGTLPRWGDGQSNPAALDREVTVDSDLFEAPVRGPLVEFFRRALRRNHAERYDNAEEMLKAWHAAFEKAGAAAGQGAATGDGEAEEPATAWSLDGVTLDTQLAVLGLSARAFNALDRLNCVTVRDLLRLPLKRVFELRGVGTRTKKSLTQLVRELGQRLPMVEREADSAPGEPAVPASARLDVIAGSLLARRRGKAEPSAKDRGLAMLLGLDVPSAGQLPFWPSQTEVAKPLDVTRALISQALGDARKRWAKLPALTAVRDDIVALLDGSGFVMTAEELVAALLATRGSDQEDPSRTTGARAVVRAALETESFVATPRWMERRHGDRLIVARNGAHEATGLAFDGQALADFADKLGRAADDLASRDPLPAPSQAAESVDAIARPEALRSIPTSRLLQLAVAVSRSASLSSRLEVYPRGLAAVRAAKLSRGALLGATDLTADDVRQRVAARYPEAERLPDRPDLDAVLSDAGCELTWERSARAGQGAYVAPRPRDLTTVTSATSHARPGLFAQAATIDEPFDVAQVRLFEEKLHVSRKEGGFLALVVAPTHAACAAEALCRRFDLVRRSLDEALLGQLKTRAERAGADWSVVLGADGAMRDSRDWNNLQALVKQSMPAVLEEILRSEQPVLLEHVGLLVRYEQMSVLDELCDKAGRPGLVPNTWVLVPSDLQATGPVIDGRSVPVIGPAQWAPIPKPWLAQNAASHARIGSRLGG